MRRALVLCCLLTMGQLAGAASPSDQRLTFEQHIRPILKAHCFECHGEGAELAGGLDLRLKRFLIAGGDSGSAVVPAQPPASLLLTRASAGEMPPGEESKKLTSPLLSTARRTKS